MASIIADNIISPLGFTTEQTYQAILSGKTALCRHEASNAIPFTHTSALFTQSQIDNLQVDGCTRFESLAIRSIHGALGNANIPLDGRTVLILSSTKGNVELLQVDSPNEEIVNIGASARRIASAVGVVTKPISVSNACISGVSGIILGSRLIESGQYDYAIVCGVDVQNSFIISGFQSLKALSETECRPFDIERRGLNLGEAAGTIILGKETQSWQVLAGACRNDAFHITNPSPQGTGSATALRDVLDGLNPDNIAVLNAHGTATMYNDQMESRAIAVSGLSCTPVNGLKGYLGHTMGAAGVVETILTQRALQDGVILGTKGFETPGVSGKVNLSASSRESGKRSFIKMISGFGGCNAAILVTEEPQPVKLSHTLPKLETTHRVKITPGCVALDGEQIATQETGLKLLTELYKTFVSDYPKYYKMDSLARLGFVASELLLMSEHEGEADCENRGIVFFNSSGSLHADIEYLKTISDTDNFFPSPSLFVYTLPNIVNGEIAIRNRYHGETAFYILSGKDDGQINNIIESTFAGSTLASAIVGWLEYKDEYNFEADLSIITKQ